MQRYFVTKKKDDIFSFSTEDAHHIKNVMRMEIGECVEIVYENNLYRAHIISLEPVQAQIAEEVPSKDAMKPYITLAQALVKEQKMDFILQKTTELGIDEIIPLTTVRSVVKTNDKTCQKVVRWQRIVKEASEQSKRTSIPKVNLPKSVKEVALLDYDLKILCTVNELSKNLNKVLSNLSKRARILFVIGAEGGFTKEEEQYFLDHGFVSCSLGSLVLRTETASLYVMSVIQFLLSR